MSLEHTWAIGDIQGCFDEFLELVALIDQRSTAQGPARLWLVGDLINRGPASLEVLQWVIENEDRCKVVLGNHDLNFLAVAAGVRRLKPDDTLGSLIASKHRKAWSVGFGISK